MRVDKYLKVARILKRRSLANQAADLGKVFVNGRVVKPSYKLKVGDILEIAFNSGAIKLEVLELKETVKKEEADSLYKIISE
jgi:ribosomal 50S subunit-recycling heat shock protein